MELCNESAYDSCCEWGVFVILIVAVVHKGLTRPGVDRSKLGLIDITSWALEYLKIQLTRVLN